MAKQPWAELERAVGVLEARVRETAVSASPLRDEELGPLFYRIRMAIAELRSVYGGVAPIIPQTPAGGALSSYIPLPSLEAARTRIALIDALQHRKRRRANATAPNGPPILGLSPELWLNVFGWLDVKSLGRASCACATLRRIADNAALWQQISHTGPYPVPDPVPEPMSDITSSSPSPLVDWKWSVRRKAIAAKHWATGEHRAAIIDAHSSKVVHVQFNDAAIFSCSARHLKEWNSATLALTDTFTTAANLHSFAFDDDQLMICAEDAVRSYDRKTKRFQFALDTLSEVKHLRFTSELIATASGHGYLHLWKNTRGFGTPTIATAFQGHNAPIHGLDVDGSFTTIATGSSDRSVKIWDVPTSACIATLKGHSKSVLSVKLAVDAGHRLVWTGARDGAVRLFDLRTLQCVSRLALHAESVNCIDWDGSARRLVSGGADSKIAVVDAAMMRELYALKGHEGGVNCLQMGGDRIVSGGADRHIAIFQFGI